MTAATRFPCTAREPQAAEAPPRACRRRGRRRRRAPALGPARELVRRCRRGSRSSPRRARSYRMRITSLGKLILTK
ncbi:MAG: hemin uptake protein HemP [Comamonadaceae bacterium]|nr:hemin uptake protein HemP [Comamonadaceae bacterium]